jgi:hypothetical protein
MVGRDNGPNLQWRNTETEAETEREAETAAETAAVTEAETETEERNGNTSINTNTEGLLVQGEILYKICTREIERETQVCFIWIVKACSG